MFLVKGQGHSDYNVQYCTCWQHLLLLYCFNLGDTALNKQFHLYKHLWEEIYLLYNFILQNIMEFKKLSIDGKAYGDCLDRSGNVVDITEVMCNPIPYMVFLSFLACMFFEEKNSGYCDTLGVITKLQPYLMTQKLLNIFK